MGNSSPKIVDQLLLWMWELETLKLETHLANCLLITNLYPIL